MDGLVNLETAIESSAGTVEVALGPEARRRGRAPTTTTRRRVSPPPAIAAAAYPPRRPRSAHDHWRCFSGWGLQHPWANPGGDLLGAESAPGVTSSADDARHRTASGDPMRY